MNGDLRKNFIFFLILSGVVIISLFSLPFIEPKLKDTIGGFFEITESTEESNLGNSNTIVQTTEPVITPVQSPSTAPVINQPAAEPKLSETAKNLSDILFRIFKLLLWMILIVAIIGFINALIFNTVLKNTSNYELATLLRNVLSIIIYVAAFATIFKSQFPGIDLSTVFAGSTIVGVVLGLALQDTLGIYLRVLPCRRISFFKSVIRLTFRIK